MTGNKIIEQEWAILYLFAIPALGKSEIGRVATGSSQSAWPMWCDGGCQLSRIWIHLEVSL